MSKSIFVIDTREKCNKCPLLAIDGRMLDAFCLGFMGYRKRIGVYISEGIDKSYWCPLEDLSEKKHAGGQGKS